MAPLSRSCRNRVARGDRNHARGRSVAGVRGERFERGVADRAARVRRPGAHRCHLRADVPDARTDRPGHRGHRGGRRAGRRLHARPDRGRTRDGRTPTPRGVPHVAEQPDRSRRTGRTGAPAPRPRARPRRRRRGIRAVLRLDGTRPRQRGPTTGGHPHVLQDVVDGGRPTRLSGRAVMAGRRTRQGGVAVSPRRCQADCGAPRAAVLRRHERPGRPHRVRTFAHRRHHGRSPARRVPERRQLRAVPCAPRRAHRP